MAEAAKKTNYVGVWIALAVLTMAEVSVALMGMPRNLTILVLLGLALWKALLVALYYMHLRFEPRMLKIVVAAPLLPAVILVVVVLMEY